MSRKRRKKKAPAPPRQRTRTPAPAVPPIPLCSMCHEPHVGNSEESFDSLMVLDSEVGIFYDRDLANASNVNGLCGPRFRRNPAGLFAHYGSPHGASYVVFQWNLDKLCWTLIIDHRHWS